MEAELYIWPVYITEWPMRCVLTPVYEHLYFTCNRCLNVFKYVALLDYAVIAHSWQNYITEQFLSGI